MDIVIPAGDAQFLFDRCGEYIRQVEAYNDVAHIAPLIKVLLRGA
jgi:hypothetical protein